MTDMNETYSQVWVDEIRLTDAGRLLEVTFSDGDQHQLTAEYLRVESPSAEVQGHGPGEKKIVTGKENVLVTDAEPVGRYAVRLVFDDGHDSGLFTWDYLYALGESAH